MYLRFVVSQIHEDSERQLGVFHAASCPHTRIGIKTGTVLDIAPDLHKIDGGLRRKNVAILTQTGLLGWQGRGPVGFPEYPGPGQADRCRAESSR